MKSDFVGLVELPLKVDVRMSLGQLLLGGDQMRIEAVDTERFLEFRVSSIRSSFRVYLESLVEQVNIFSRNFLLSALTSRMSSKSRSPSAFWRASQASSADMSATRELSKTRFALHSEV